MADHIKLLATIPEIYAGKRLDIAVAKLFKEYSRERLKSWILSGECLINGEKRQPKEKVLGGESIELQASIITATIWQPEKIALDVVYEDDDIIVVNKPINCVVHPGNGNSSKTLVNALLYYAPELKLIPRAGIVHRLDKDTSGLMVVARTLTAHNSLINQLQKKTVNRSYEAVIWGVITAGGTIDAPIARHPRDRIKMALVESGKPAVTHYRVLTRFRGHTHIKLQLETGRTHQIRVHMASIKHYIIGDQTYGGRLRLPKNASPALVDTLRDFPRQALHSKILGLIHPVTHEAMQWEVPLPADLQQLLTCLQEDLNYNKP